MGYSHIARNIIPAMRGTGFTEAEISAITVEVPARVLNIEEVR